MARQFSITEIWRFFVAILPEIIRLSTGAALHLHSICPSITCESNGEHLQGEVVITTKNELLEYLYECDNEFSSEISTRILKDITLTAREDFMKAPAGFRKEDVYPWRFNRQYMVFSLQTNLL